MEKNNLIKKGLVIAVILLFISVSVIPSTSASLDSDVEITISAGVLRKSWGNIGIGLVVTVANSCNHNITGFCIIDYYTLSGDFIRRVKVGFGVPPNAVFGYVGINIIDSPPINRLTITVETDSKTASRSGIEIGPFVFLEK